jgi:hypothetical protein
MRKCSQLANNRKAWNDLVHWTQTHVTVAMSEEEEKEDITL